MELWDAYTKDGRLTGEKLVRGQPMPRDVYHLVCEALVRHTDGSYLLMHRSKEKHAYSGYYEATAGGSALCGEDAHACIRRELFEETGILCDTFFEVAYLVADRERYNVLFHSFVCTVDCDKDIVTLQEGETDGYVWLSEPEFIEFLHSDKVIKTQFERYKQYYKEMNFIK